MRHAGGRPVDACRRSPLPCGPPTRCTDTPMIESLLLTAARIFTFEQQRLLTNASSFFFERSERLFLVTSRHVMIDEPSKHFPDRIEIELHIDPDNMAKSTGFSIPLYRHGKSIWRQGLDTAGEIDVAVIEIECDIFAYGFTQVRCGECGPLTFSSPFSCTGRGVFETR